MEIHPNIARGHCISFLDNTDNTIKNIALPQSVVSRIAAIRAKSNTSKLEVVIKRNRDGKGYSVEELRIERNLFQRALGFILRIFKRKKWKPHLR